LPTRKYSEHPRDLVIGILPDASNKPFLSPKHAASRFDLLIPTRHAERNQAPKTRIGHWRIFEELGRFQSFSSIGTLVNNGGFEPPRSGSLPSKSPHQPKHTIRFDPSFATRYRSDSSDRSALPVFEQDRNSPHFRPGSKRGLGPLPERPGGCFAQRCQTPF
jgi:hypothetical protein